MVQIFRILPFWIRRYQFGNRVLQRNLRVLVTNSTRLKITPGKWKYPIASTLELKTSPESPPSDNSSSSISSDDSSVMCASTSEDRNNSSASPEISGNLASEVSQNHCLDMNEINEDFPRKDISESNESSNFESYEEISSFSAFEEFVDCPLLDESQ